MRNACRQTYPEAWLPSRRRDLAGPGLPEASIVPWAELAINFLCHGGDREGLHSVLRLPGVPILISTMRALNCPSVLLHSPQGVLGALRSRDPHSSDRAIIWRPCCLWMAARLGDRDEAHAVLGRRTWKLEREPVAKEMSTACGLVRC